MTTYRKIHGRAVKSVSSNLSAPSAEGQIWFNTTDNKFRSIVALEAWISSGPLPTTRQNVEGCGTQTAGLASSGATGPSGPAFLNTSCEYNGTGWSGTDTKNTPGVIAEAVFGTQTAAVAAGGYSSGGSTVNTVEEYNGSSWTAVNTLPAAQRSGMGCGAENSGLVAGGEAATVLTNTQEYDGTNWTAGGAIPAATYNAGAGGTSESNSWFAGGGDGFKNATLIYDGSSWTASGNINTARDQHGGAGISTAALIFGGRTPPSTTSSATEKFDGTSWTTSPATLGTAAKQSAAFGTKTAAIYAGNDPAANITQEYNSSVNAITAAAWSSGGNHPQNIRGGGSAGTQTAAWYVGGLQYPSDTKNRTDEYDGSSWTNVNNLPTNFFNGNSCGSLTAGLIFGSNAGFGTEEQTYEYDGTNWTAGGSLPDIGPAYGSAGGGGTQTAAVACGGYGDPPPGVTNVVEYNGTSWSANPNSLPAANYSQAGDGTSTALWLAGGYLVNSTTLHFDGTSFSTSGSLVNSRQYGTGAGYGTQTNAIVAGGDPTHDSQGEQYNGTSWVSAANLSQARKYGLGASRSAGSTTGFICGGATPPNPNTNATEEFTPESTALNIKDLTQSS